MHPFNTPRQPSVFDKQKGRVQNTVNNVLSAEQFTEELYQKIAKDNAFVLLELNINARDISVYRTTLRMNEIPPGVPFMMSNQEYDITTCKIPFTGPQELAEFAMNGVNGHFVELHRQYVIAKAYDACAQSDIERAKAQLKRGVDSIQGYFIQANDKAKAFNESLPGYIASLAYNRRLLLDERNAKKDAMDPFK